jgi:tetratricopeptide (TPR) repeat protein
VAKDKEKAKKDEYQKTMAAYTLAMKDFHKKNYGKASQSILAFLETYSSEKELVDRARIYLKICENQLEKAPETLKTIDDYYESSIIKINKNEPDEALKLLEEAQKMKPEEGKIFFLMADALCLMEKEDECLENLRKAIQIDESFAILAQNEPDFEPLWNNKKFNLITRMT